MDFRTSLLEENLSCPVCRDIFRDPVLLLCSHSFCRTCLQQCWEKRTSQECPVCRTPSYMEHPPSNLVLRNLCEDFRSERSLGVPSGPDLLCTVHGEKLRLFCMEDRVPLCLVCRDSKKHTNHTFYPIDEAAKELKVSFQIIKAVRSYEAYKIKEEFVKLHHFLQDEEAARISALREEEEQKNQMMLRKVEEASYLSETFMAIEQELSSDDLLFLQNYSTTMTRYVQFLYTILAKNLNPPSHSTSLIRVAEHLGNLKFKVWEKMRAATEYAPVTLDPNTAHPCLLLSRDLTNITLGIEMQQLPDNPERFGGYASVLGSEGFSSGVHRWDVDVGDGTAWAVGVITESEWKKRNLSSFALWYIGFYNGKYGKGHSSELLTPLTVDGRPRRVTVQLDWDKGTLSFHNAITGVHLYTFTHAFTERLFPYFCNVSSAQTLRILPAKEPVPAGLDHSCQGRAE
uniref:Tripartite motif-containing protein 35-like n=1 Tax=Denticeps clupeoides TaxID=299321 RepID=A0AAY4D344_9TELE